MLEHRKPPCHCICHGVSETPTFDGCSCRQTRTIDGLQIVFIGCGARWRTA